jgi:hypothetical protein
VCERVCVWGGGLQMYEMYSMRLNNNYSGCRR